MDKKMYELNLDNETFKKLKKHKRVIYLQLEDNNLSKLEETKKVIITNKETNKQLIRKVKKVYRKNNLQELKTTLKKKTKYIMPKNFEEIYSNEEKIIGMEFNKKKIFRKIFLGILIILLFGFMICSTNKLLLNINNKKVSSAINEVSKEKISYIFIEINPSLVLTIKDNKVSDVACLNDDCVSFYNEIDIKGKNINDGIDNIYNLSKEKGFDVSSGVKIKTTEDLKIENKEYITIEYIDNTTKNELLTNVKNNEDIKNSSNDKYYDKLWKELKKDSEYDKVYTCKMNNNELECYFIMSALETGINRDSDYNTATTEAYNNLMSLFNGYKSKIFTTFEKFNMEVKNNKIYINDIEFGAIPLFTFNNIPYKNVLSAEIIDTLPNEVCRLGFAEYKDGKCEINDGVYLVPIEKINLLNPSSILNNMITNRLGVKENTLQQYEINKLLNNK